MLPYEQYIAEKTFLQNDDNRIIFENILDSGASIEKMIEDLKKLIDKSDEETLKRLLLQFKKDRIHSLISRAITERGLTGVKVEQAIAVLSDAIGKASVTIPQLASFLKKVVKGSFGIEAKLTPGIHKFSDIIPVDDPVLSQIWKDLYNDTKALTSGITSSGKGEFLLMVLGGRESGKNNDDGGDISFNGIGCEIKLPGGQIWARSPSTVYRDELHAGIVRDALLVDHSDMFSKADADIFFKKYKTSKKDVYFFSELLEYISSKGGDKRKAMAVTSSITKSIYLKHYNSLKPIFYKCIDRSLNFNTKTFQNEMITFNLDLYKSIKKWKYMILFNSRTSVDTIAIIESGDDLRSGKIPYSIFNHKKGPENLIFYTADSFW